MCQNGTLTFTINLSSNLCKYLSNNNLGDKNKLTQVSTNYYLYIFCKTLLLQLKKMKANISDIILIKENKETFGIEERQFINVYFYEKVQMDAGYKTISKFYEAAALSRATEMKLL